MLKRTIILFSVFVLSVIFISVGLSKIMGHDDFVQVLHQSPLVRHFIGLVAYPVPILEILVGLALWVPAFRALAFRVSIVLMAVFTLYNIYLVFFAPKVPCACGGIFKDMSWQTHLLINTGLLALAIAGSMLTRKEHHGQNSVPVWQGTFLTLKKRRSVGNQ